jgi:hypothetical protein
MIAGLVARALSLSHDGNDNPLSCGCYDTLQRSNRHHELELGVRRQAALAVRE